MEPEFAERSQQIGHRLRSERQRRGWSLNDLSAKTNGALSKSRISNYEQGIRRMGIEAAQHLAQAMETVTPAWLLLLDDDTALKDEERSLLQDFRTLDATSQQEVSELIRSKMPADSRQAAT